MIFQTKKYTVQLDDKGAIVSLISGGKQFLKTRLPLLNLQLRSGEKTEILNSDDAKDIVICKADDNVTIKYDFDDLIVSASLIFSNRIEANFSFKNHTGMYVEWVDFCQYAIPNDLVARGGSGKIVVDVNEGLLLEDISLKEQFYPNKFRPMNYPSEGLYSMFPAVIQSQFLSYYDDTAGI